MTALCRTVNPPNAIVAGFVVNVSVKFWVNSHIVRLSFDFSLARSDCESIARFLGEPRHGSLYIALTYTRENASETVTAGEVFFAVTSSDEPIGCPAIYLLSFLRKGRNCSHPGDIGLSGPFVIRAPDHFLQNRLAVVHEVYLG